MAAEPFSASADGCLLLPQERPKMVRRGERSNVPKAAPLEMEAATDRWLARADMAGDRARRNESHQ